jgi:predicted methyltransferase
MRALLGESLHQVLATVRRTEHDRRVGSADDARRAELYKQWVKPGDSVFDIGANIGNWTRVFAEWGAGVIAGASSALLLGASRTFNSIPRIL